MALPACLLAKYATTPRAGGFGVGVRVRVWVRVRDRVRVRVRVRVGVRVSVRVRIGVTPHPPASQVGHDAKSGWFRGNPVWCPYPTGVKG